MADTEGFRVKRVEKDGIWLRDGRSSHPDFPRSPVYTGPVILYPGDIDWNWWNDELGEDDGIALEPGPF